MPVDGSHVTIHKISQNTCGPPESTIKPCTAMGDVSGLSARHHQCVKPKVTSRSWLNCGDCCCVFWISGFVRHRRNKFVFTLHNKLFTQTYNILKYSWRLFVGNHLGLDLVLHMGSHLRELLHGYGSTTTENNDFMCLINTAGYEYN